MSMNLIGDCADCIDSICTMNCSSAVLASGTDWIAASIWAGVFPEKATAAQVSEFLAQHRMTCPITADRDAWRGAVTDADRDLAARWTKVYWEADGIRTGKSDHHPFVQEIARHRLAAEASFKAREAELVRALQAIGDARLLPSDGDPGVLRTFANEVLARAHTATEEEVDSSDDAPCTDCGDTGWTHQTERHCTCGAPASDAYDA